MTTISPSFTPAQRALARQRKVEARQEALQDQQAKRILVVHPTGEWIIQPAIGKTGGAANVGWELHPPRLPLGAVPDIMYRRKPKPGSHYVPGVWYFRDPETAHLAVGRHTQYWTWEEYPL